MKRKTFRRIITVLIGTIISIPILVFGFIFVEGQLTRANDAAPRDVVVTNVGDTSATIQWTTDQETQGVVEYGTTPTSLVFFAPEVTRTNDHTVNLTLLTPSTTHYFQIRVGDETFDNGGVPWTFTTRSEGVNSEIDPTATPNITSQPTDPTRILQPSPTIQSQVPTITQKLITPSITNSEAIPPTDEGSTCPVTDDCQEIINQFGKGCSTADYQRCLRRGISPTPVLSSPINLDANTISSSSISLTWEYPYSGIAGYQVQRSEDSSSGYSVVQTLNGMNATTFEDTDLESGTIYYYRVRAFTDGQEAFSGYSNISEATTSE